MSTPAENAATVREALDEQYADALNPLYPTAALAALAALLAKAEQNDWAKDEAGDFYAALKAAEAERDAAVRAAEEARFALRTAEAAMLKDRQDVRAAEQAAEQAQEALRQIVDPNARRFNPDGSLVSAQQIARAALIGEGTGQ